MRRKIFIQPVSVLLTAALITEAVPLSAAADAFAPALTNSLSPTWERGRVRGLAQAAFQQQALAQDLQSALHGLFKRRARGYQELERPVLAMQSNNRHAPELMAVLNQIADLRRRLGKGIQESHKPNLHLEVGLTELMENLNGVLQRIPRGENDWLPELAEDILDWVNATRINPADYEGESGLDKLVARFVKESKGKLQPYRDRLAHSVILKSKEARAFLYGQGELPEEPYKRPTHEERHFLQTTFLNHVLARGILEGVREYISFPVYQSAYAFSNSKYEGYLSDHFPQHYMKEGYKDYYRDHKLHYRLQALGYMLAYAHRNHFINDHNALLLGQGVFAMQPPPTDSSSGGGQKKHTIVLKDDELIWLHGQLRDLANDLYRAFYRASNEAGLTRVSLLDLARLLEEVHPTSISQELLNQLDAAGSEIASSIRFFEDWSSGHEFSIGAERVQAIDRATETLRDADDVRKGLATWASGKLRPVHGEPAAAFGGEPVEAQDVTQPPAALGPAQAELFGEAIALLSEAGTSSSLAARSVPYMRSLFIGIAENITNKLDKLSVGNLAGAEMIGACASSRKYLASAQEDLGSLLRDTEIASSPESGTIRRVHGLLQDAQALLLGLEQQLREGRMDPGLFHVIRHILAERGRRYQKVFEDARNAQKFYPIPGDARRRTPPRGRWSAPPRPPAAPPKAVKPVSETERLNREITALAAGAIRLRNSGQVAEAELERLRRIESALRERLGKVNVPDDLRRSAYLRLDRAVQDLNLATQRLPKASEPVKPPAPPLTEPAPAQEPVAILRAIEESLRKALKPLPPSQEGVATLQVARTELRRIIVGLTPSLKQTDSRSYWERPGWRATPTPTAEPPKTPPVEKLLDVAQRLEEGVGELRSKVEGDEALHSALEVFETSAQELTALAETLRRGEGSSPVAATGGPIKDAKGSTLVVVLAAITGLAAVGPLWQGLFDFNPSFRTWLLLGLLVVSLAGWGFMRWFKYQVIKEAGMLEYDKKWQKLYSRFIDVSWLYRAESMMGGEKSLRSSKDPLVRELGPLLFGYKRAVKTAHDLNSLSNLDQHVQKLEEWVRNHDGELIPYPFFNDSRANELNEWLSPMADDASRDMLSRITKIFTAAPGGAPPKGSSRGGTYERPVGIPHLLVTVAITALVGTAFVWLAGPWSSSETILKSLEANGHGFLALVLGASTLTGLTTANIINLQVFHDLRQAQQKLRHAAQSPGIDGRASAVPPLWEAWLGASFFYPGSFLGFIGIIGTIREDPHYIGWLIFGAYWLLVGSGLLWWASRIVHQGMTRLKDAEQGPVAPASSAPQPEPAPTAEPANLQEHSPAPPITATVNNARIPLESVFHPQLKAPIQLTPQLIHNGIREWNVSSLADQGTLEVYPLRNERYSGRRYARSQLLHYRSKQFEGRAVIIDPIGTVPSPRYQRLALVGGVRRWGRMRMPQVRFALLAQVTDEAVTRFNEDDAQPYVIVQHYIVAGRWMRMELEPRQSSPTGTGSKQTARMRSRLQSFVAVVTSSLLAATALAQEAPSMSQGFTMIQRMLSPLAIAALVVGFGAIPFGTVYLGFNILRRHVLRYAGEPPAAAPASASPVSPKGRPDGGVHERFPTRRGPDLAPQRRYTTGLLGIEREPVAWHPDSRDPGPNTPPPPAPQATLNAGMAILEVGRMIAGRGKAWLVVKGRGSSVPFYSLMTYANDSYSVGYGDRRGDFGWRRDYLERLLNEITFWSLLEDGNWTGWGIEGNYENEPPTFTLQPHFRQAGQEDQQHIRTSVAANIALYEEVTHEIIGDLRDAIFSDRYDLGRFAEVVLEQYQKQFYFLGRNDLREPYEELPIWNMYRESFQGVREFSQRRSSAEGGGMSLAEFYCEHAKKIIDRARLRYGEVIPPEQLKSRLETLYKTIHRKPVRFSGPEGNIENMRWKELFEFAEKLQHSGAAQNLVFVYLDEGNQHRIAVILNEAARSDTTSQSKGDIRQLEDKARSLRLLGEDQRLLQVPSTPGTQKGISLIDGMVLAGVVGLLTAGLLLPWAAHAQGFGISVDGLSGLSPLPWPAGLLLAAPLMLGSVFQQPPPTGYSGADQADPVAIETAGYLALAMAWHDSIGGTVERQKKIWSVYQSFRGRYPPLPSAKLTLALAIYAGNNFMEWYYRAESLDDVIEGLHPPFVQRLEPDELAMAAIAAVTHYPGTKGEPLLGHWLVLEKEFANEEAEARPVLIWAASFPGVRPAEARSAYHELVKECKYPPKAAAFITASAMRHKPREKERSSYRYSSSSSSDFMSASLGLLASLLSLMNTLDEMNRPPSDKHRDAREHANQLTESGLAPETAALLSMAVDPEDRGGRRQMSIDQYREFLSRVQAEKPKPQAGATKGPKGSSLTGNIVAAGVAGLFIVALLLAGRALGLGTILIGVFQDNPFASLFGLGAASLGGILYWIAVMPDAWINLMEKVRHSGLNTGVGSMGGRASPPESPRSRSHHPSFPQPLLRAA